MSLFAKAFKKLKDAPEEIDDVDEKDDDHQRTSRETLINELVSSYVSCQNGDTFRRAVLDDLYVFLIVYDVFVDLRSCSVPSEAHNLNLPIWADISAYDECWWDNAGWNAIEESVLWRGRGLLAKSTLLLHALVSSLEHANCSPPVWNKGVNDSYGYFGIMDSAMEHTDKHPLTVEASLSSIKALLAFSEIYLFCDMDWRMEVVRDKFLSKLEYILEDRCKMKLDKSKPTEEERVLKLMREARERGESRDEKLRSIVYPLLKRAATEPLVCVDDPGPRLLKCTEQWKELVDDWFDEDHGCCISVTRMRLSGNHSTEYLLKTALCCPCIKTLDLRRCSNLDEDVLDAMTQACSSVTLCILKDTDIPENSPVVSKLAKRGCVVDFSDKHCRCCDSDRFTKRRRK